MKTRGTSLLLVLFFVGLGFLWWADFAKIQTRKQIERMGTRVLPELLDAKPDDLRKIEILGGPERLVFVRQDRDKGNGWQMISPLNVEADPSKVESLAYNLKELARKPEAAPIEGDPARFGLAPPERVIRLWGNEASEPMASLDVGFEAEKITKRFVRPTGSDGIEVVDAKTLALLRLPAISWRNRDLFRVPTFEVDGVRLTSPSGELKLQRGRDAWRIVSPIKTLATEARVDGLIADLGSVRVGSDTQFVANDVSPAALERYGLKNPALTIEIDAHRSNVKRPPQILHVGKLVEGNNAQVYVLRDGQDDVLAVDSRVLKDLKIDPDRYRSPKVADIKLDRVAKITVEQPEGGFEVVRSGNDWKIIKPSMMPTDRKQVEEFLKSLDKLETNTYLKPTSASVTGLDASAQVLKIWQVANPRDLRPRPPGSALPEPGLDLALNLRIGRRDAARRSIYAQLDGDPIILALPDIAHDYLPRNVLAFRDRQILNEETDPIQRMTLVVGGRKLALNAPPLKFDPFRNLPLGWWMVEPVDAPADAASVGALLKMLAGLRAESLVSEKADNPEAYGLKNPALTLTWSRLPSPTTSESSTEFPLRPVVIPLEERSLIVGSAVPGRQTSRFAKLSDQPMIFTLSPETVTILDLEMRNHQVISYNPRRVRKIRFDWPSRSFTVDSSGETDKPTWSFEGPVDAPDFDLNQLNTLVKTVSNLSTNRFTQHLGEFPAYAGLNPSRLSVRFDLDDGTIPRILRVGRPDGRGNIFATIENEPSGAIFLLPEAAISTWLKPPRATGDLPDNVFAP